MWPRHHTEVFLSFFYFLIQLAFREIPILTKLSCDMFIRLDKVQKIHARLHIQRFFFSIELTLFLFKYLTSGMMNLFLSLSSAVCFLLSVCVKKYVYTKTSERLTSNQAHKIVWIVGRLCCKGSFFSKTSSSMNFEKHISSKF